MITSSSEDFKSVVEGLDVGVCSEDIDVEAVEKALGSLALPSLRLIKGQNGLKAHRTAFHYEKQFEPVAEHLRLFLGQKKVA